MYSSIWSFGSIQLHRSRSTEKERAIDTGTCLLHEEVHCASSYRLALKCGKGFVSGSHLDAS